MGEILSGMRKKAVLFVVALVMIAAIFPTHKVYATTENEQTPSVVVSDYSNLKYAIESANDGDVIGINGMIEVDNGYRLSLGDYGKTVTLLRMSQDAGIKIKNTEGSSFKYLILDGNRKSFPDAVPMLQIVNTQSFSMYGVEIKNCSSESSNGGAVLMTNRSNGEWRKCSFTDNNANKGGHISIEDCSELRIFESTLTEGQAEMGGAVYCSEYSYCSISDSILTGNQAEICGGGVCNFSSTISLCNTLIYGNAAKAGADIATQNESSPYFDDMDSLYETVGIKPERWVNDYVAGTVDLPDWIVPDKENCLLKMEYSLITEEENGNSQEGENTQEDATDNESEENDILIVNDLEALIVAMENVSDGAIIGIGKEIDIDTNISLFGYDSKKITIVRMSDEAYINIKQTEKIKIKNICFDGNGDKYNSYMQPMIAVYSDADFENIEIKNCNSYTWGGAIQIRESTNVTIKNSVFNNNSSGQGGHIAAESATVTLENVILENGHSSGDGGAISIADPLASFTIKNCLIRNNDARLGGGIHNKGILLLQNSVIYGNSAIDCGNEIVNQMFASFTMESLEELQSLYAKVGILPKKWENDFDENAMMPPNLVDPSQDNSIMSLTYEVIPIPEENEQDNQENSDSDKGNDDDNTAADSATDSTPDSTNDSDSSSENKDNSNQENVNEGDSEKNPEDISDSDSNSSDSESSNAGDNADTQNQEQQSNSNDSQDDNQSDNSNQADNEQSEENRQQSDEGQQSNDNQSNSNNQANTENQESNDNQSNDVSGSNNVGQNENTSINDNSSSGNGQSDSSDNVNQGGVDKGTENTPSIPSNSTNTESEGKNPVEKTDNNITDSKPNEESKAEDSGDKADDKAELNSKPDDNTATDTQATIKTESKEDTSSTSKPDKVTTPKKTTKVIKTIKATAKKGKKVVSGTTLKKATVKVKIGKKTYKVKSDSKGKYKIKLKSKLKKGTKITITVSKKGYKTKSKSLKVK